MTGETLAYLYMLVPLADEVVWDPEEKHLAVNTHSTKGPNLNYYDVDAAWSAIQIALKKRVPVYVFKSKTTEKKSWFSNKTKVVTRFYRERVHKNPVER